MNPDVYFQQFDSLVNTVIKAALTYACLILFLRITGKRILSQMNIFDFVVTVAFGSTVASTLLSSDTSIAQGLTALLSLIILQYAVARLEINFGWFSKLIKSQPRLLFHNGDFLEPAMNDERVNKEEIYQAVRSSGLASLDDVQAVILETNGNFSVIKKSDQPQNTTLGNVK